MVLKNIKLVLLIVLILVLSSDNISFASVIEIEDDVIAKKSEITDSLIFENGGLLSFNVTWNDSFTKTINSTITLTNNENIEKYYNVYLVIEENELIHTLENTELSLKITSPEGEITTNKELKYKEDGFDITSLTGIFEIANNYKIKLDNENLKIDSWYFDITLKNLNSINLGKTFKCYIVLTEKDLTNYEVSKINTLNVRTTGNSITTNIKSNEKEILNYYYAIKKSDQAIAIPLNNPSILINGLSFYKTNKSGYTFYGLEKDTFYDIYIYTEDEMGIKSNIYQTSISTNEDYVIPSINNVVASVINNELVVTIDAKKGSKEIQKYYFSIDNGITYVESDINTYKFSNLMNNNYKLKVKVSDQQNIYSPEYFEEIMF
ncbi:MAG: hypothetical protein E7172_04725 [Firmicutes bacterium]|nr:hypothetical protein [Bacillota bacterium]